MHLLSLSLALLAAASSTTALVAGGVASALVSNDSKKPFYLWSVGSIIGPPNEIAPRGLYYEPLHRDDKAGGIALKITKTANGLYTGQPQQIFAYTLVNDTVWFDLSTVFGEPFIGQRLEVTSDSGDQIVWPKGSHPGGSQVKSASSSGNIWLTVFGGV